MNRLLTSTTLSLFRSPTPKSIILTTVRFATGGFSRGPAPPLLDRREQRDFDELIRKVNLPASKASAASEEGGENGGVASARGENDIQAAIDEDEAVMHPDFRQKPRRAFEGEVDPETGEIGGPKSNPLSHGECLSFATGVTLVGMDG